MTRYAVELTPTALASIAAQARFIAVDAQAPLEAQRWLARLRAAIQSLERWPRRTSLAEEHDYVDYEVRQLVVDRHLVLFTVDEARRTIHVVGLRHGHRRPRPGELPPDAGSDAEPDA